MAIPQPTQARTAARSLLEYTVAEPDNKADTTTASTAPTISSIATNPATTVIIGMDAQTATATLGALADGASGSIDVTVPFPNLPANLQFSIADRVMLVANAALSHSIAGVALSSLKVTPQGFGGQRYITGPLLSPNTIYGAYNARVQATFTASAASTAGPVTVAVNALLLDTPG